MDMARIRLRVPIKKLNTPSSSGQEKAADGSSNTLNRKCYVCPGQILQVFTSIYTTHRSRHRISLDSNSLHRPIRQCLISVLLSYSDHISSRGGLAHLNHMITLSAYGLPHTSYFFLAPTTVCPCRWLRGSPDPLL